ncbi:hypothetical protein BLNAU_16055 [Blattamonas nauphoetae]|uniref:Uncharacterized protein n=1 Tax=Blattamonas nauphoetae TaxID=2049346 RepID=A0ABQ9XCI0_9EUKA|nr:hypothetical protein BLNAU_16055 [Blattamonas nauphoetae]
MDDRTNPPLPQQHLLPHNLLLLRLHNLTLRHFQTQSGSEHSVTEMFGAPPKCVRRRVDVSFHNMVFLEPYALFGGIIVILIKLAYIRHVKRDLLSRMSPSTPIHFSNKSKFVFVLPHGSSPSSDFVDITKHIPRDSIDSRIYFVDKSSPQQSLSIMQLEKNLSTHVSTPYQIILLPLGKTSSFNYFSNFYRCFAVFFRVLLTFLGTSPRFVCSSSVFSSLNRSSFHPKTTALFHCWQHILHGFFGIHSRS